MLAPHKPRLYEAFDSFWAEGLPTNTDLKPPLGRDRGRKSLPLEFSS